MSALARLGVISCCIWPVKCAVPAEAALPLWMELLYLVSAIHNITLKQLVRREVGCRFVWVCKFAKLVALTNFSACSSHHAGLQLTGLRKQRFTLVPLTLPGPCGLGLPYKIGSSLRQSCCKLEQLPQKTALTRAQLPPKPRSGAAAIACTLRPRPTLCEPHDNPKRTVATLTCANLPSPQHASTFRFSTAFSAWTQGGAKRLPTSSSYIISSCLAPAETSLASPRSCSAAASCAC